MTLELPVQGGAAIVTIVVPLSDFSGRVLLGSILNRSPHTPRVTELFRWMCLVQLAERGGDLWMWKTVAG